ncbi:MAG TPA: hypothetical protein VN811_09920, partial [Thermoanaerobaculia bacterium]|nr:hypothetical protein [Thermoanaerobaculia bacterium]
MRRIALAVLILAAGLLAGCDRISQRIHEYDVTHSAKERVGTILDGVKKNGRRDQKSLCLWFNGSIYINDEHEQSFASDSWDRWVTAGGLVEGVTAFELTESVLDPEAEDANTALVSGTIDGRRFTMLVPKGKTIKWVETPSGNRVASRRTPASRAARPRSTPASRPAAEPERPVREALPPRAAVADATPRPIGEGVGAAPLSTEEQAGVGLAVMYLRGGAAAWQKLLSSDSPWHSLPPAEATAEIAARVGPPDGTHWQLQHPGPNGDQNNAVFSIEYPSGLTETVWLEIASEAGKMKLRRVRALSEPWPLPPRETPKFEHIAGFPGPLTSLPGAGLTAAVFASALALALFGRGRRRRLGWAAVALAGIGFACARDKGRAGGAAVPDSSAVAAPESLRALVPLREALAEGASGDALVPLLAAAPKDGAAGDIARLWRADRMLRDYRLNEADAILGTFPNPAPYPLTALLRARLAVLRGQQDESLEHYELVRALGADDDGLRLEAAITLSTGDEEGVGDRAISRLTTLGSREAIPYYVAAENAMAEERGEEAEKLFQIGWELQPLSRDTLFSSPLLATVCTRKAAYPLIDAGGAAEPRRGGPIPGDQPLPVPAEAQASLVGQLLRVRLFGAELRVPGGQMLAPAGTIVVPADEFERSERDEQVAQLAVLVDQANADGAFAQPVLRRRLELAARGL